MRLTKKSKTIAAIAGLASSAVAEQDLMNGNENAETGLTNRMGGRFRRSTALLSVMALASTISVLMAPAASAATLTNTSWTVTNNQVSATPVSYDYSFKTATTGTIKTITFVVSGAGVGGSATPTIVKNYGIGAGTAARVGQTITYTVTGAVSISASIPIYVEFSGLTNSGTAGSYTTAITTNTNVPAVIDGPTNTSPVTLAASNTAVTVTIAKSATFTIDTTAFTLAMDPSLPALADQSQTVGLTVLTNANSGYTLTVGDSTGLKSSSTGTPVIAAVSAGKATSLAWPGADKFGYTVTATGATADGAFSASKYAGYVAAGEQVASRANPTGGTADTISIINRVAIDYGAPAGDFTDTITYTMTPNYT
jgi:hypothetical protein